jgi:hypothetical protein
MRWTERDLASSPEFEMDLKHSVREVHHTSKNAVQLVLPNPGPYPLNIKNPRVG